MHDSPYTDPEIEEWVDEYLQQAYTERLYVNHYRCECGREWDDTWSCMCNDRCPRCNKEIEPYKSEDLVCLE